MGSVAHRKPILTYQIASGEMRYVIENERTVYLQGEPETGFILYGEIPDEGDASSVNLAEVLLEFAMSWDAPGDQSEALHQMQIFGGHFGEAIADQIARTMSVSGALQRAAHALEDVFRSLNASFAVQQRKNELHYDLDPCPLRVAAEVTGMGRDVDSAYHALNAICQKLVSAIDPGLRLQLPGGPGAEHVIIVLAPTSAGSMSC